MVKIVPEGLKQTWQNTNIKSSEAITITEVFNLAGTDLAEILVSTETLVHEIKRELDVKTTIPSTLQCLCYGDQHPGFIRWQFYSCFYYFFCLLPLRGGLKEIFCWRIFGVGCCVLFFPGGSDDVLSHHARCVVIKIISVWSVRLIVFADFIDGSGAMRVLSLATLRDGFVNHSIPSFNELRWSAKKNTVIWWYHWCCRNLGPRYFIWNSVKHKISAISTSLMFISFHQ